MKYQHCRKSAPVFYCEDGGRNEDCRTVIIDNGSGWIKAGFEGSYYEGPPVKFPTVVGRASLCLSLSLPPTLLYPDSLSVGFRCLGVI
jgi:hypothetical protein